MMHHDYVNTLLGVKTMEGCRIVEAVNTRAVGQTKLRVAQNDRTIVWSFKSGHYRRYMVVKTKKRRYVTI